MADYELSRDDAELVGGGGGAAALVPFTAERIGLRHRLARDAEVISPLGVALALVRDVVERTIVSPTPDDIVRVRREAFERVVAAGAAPELVETTVEIDARRNLVRATASGATAAAGSSATENAGADERVSIAARFLRVAPANVAEVARAGGLTFYRAIETRHPRARAPAACAVDSRGIVRLTVGCAHLYATTVAGCERALQDVLEELTTFGDVGRALPNVHLAYEGRLIDLSTLAQPVQVLALAQEELRGLAAESPSSSLPRAGSRDGSLVARRAPRTLGCGRPGRALAPRWDDR